MDVLVFGTSSSLWKTLSNGQRCVRDFITLMKRIHTKIKVPFPLHLVY